MMTSDYFHINFFLPDKGGEATAAEESLVNMVAYSRAVRKQVRA
jgi:hypothetical protein